MSVLLNERIRTLRLAKGISQVDLAVMLNVSKQSVSNWENDNIQPSIDMLIRLADIFNVSTDYLLGREVSRNLDTDNLTDDELEHIQTIINDIRKQK